MEIIFARSATRHRISRTESLLVVQGAAGWVEIPPPDGGGHAEPRRLYIGRDSNGTTLEVMAVLRDDGKLLVIHAMQLRASTAVWLKEITQ